MIPPNRRGDAVSRCCASAGPVDGCTREQARGALDGLFAHHQQAPVRTGGGNELDPARASRPDADLDHQPAVRLEVLDRSDVVHQQRPDTDRVVNTRPHSRKPSINRPDPRSTDHPPCVRPPIPQHREHIRRRSPHHPLVLTHGFLVPRTIPAENSAPCRGSAQSYGTV